MQVCRCPGVKVCRCATCRCGCATYEVIRQELMYSRQGQASHVACHILGLAVTRNCPGVDCWCHLRADDIEERHQELDSVEGGEVRHRAQGPLQGGELLDQVLRVGVLVERAGQTATPWPAGPGGCSSSTCCPSSWPSGPRRSPPPGCRDPEPREPSSGRPD